MDWVSIAALIVGILSLLTGGGVIVHAVKISRRWGQIEEKVETNSRDIKNIKATQDKHVEDISTIKQGCAKHQGLDSKVENKLVEKAQGLHAEVEKVRTDLNTVLGKLRAQLTEDSEERARDLHRRLDEVKADTAANTQSVSTVLRDIEGLLAEVRELVKDAASTGANMGNLEKQVEKLDGTVSSLRERTSSLEAKIDRRSGDT